MSNVMNTPFGYDYVIDLNDTEHNGINYFTRYNKNGEREEVMSVALDSEGPHDRYNMCDTIMCKMPTGVTVADAFKMCHMHEFGYETFFVDSGLMHLYVDGKVCDVKKGDIIQLQAGQIHSMATEEDVKWRGFFHDLDSFQNGVKINAVARSIGGDVKSDPMFLEARGSLGKDFYHCEDPVYDVIPVEEMSAVRHPSRPLAEYHFDGVTLKPLVRRCENAGVCELMLAEMEPGFRVSYGYHRKREQFYVREGLVKLELFGQEYLVKGESIINVPMLAPFSITAVEKSDVYDVSGQAHWFAFLQNLESIRVNAPARLEDPATLAELKAHFEVEAETVR